MYASSEFIAMRAAPVLEPRFLAYLVQSKPFVTWAVAASDGTKMPRTDWDALGDFTLDVPSRIDQLVVADFLDEETGRLASLVRKKRQLMDLVEARFASARLRAVSGAALNSRQRRTGPVWLGAVPAHWRIERLKYVARMESGHTRTSKSLNTGKTARSRG